MREQKANDNGFPVVGEQAKEQQIFPFEQLVEYDGAANKITINANVTINGDTNIGELDIDSGDAPKGQVLTADGDSGASWENRVEYLNLESESGNLTNAQIEVAEQDNVIITLNGQFYYKNSQSDEAIVFKAPAKVVDDDTIVEKIVVDLSDNTYSYSYEVVATGGSFDPVYDNELNDSSTNAVQNKVIYEELELYAKTEDIQNGQIVAGKSEIAESLETQVGKLDQTPFSYMSSGGQTDIESGIQRSIKLVGVNLVKNQLANPTGLKASGSGTNYSYTTSGEKITLVVSATIESETFIEIGRNNEQYYWHIPVGHKYFYTLNNTNTKIHFRDNYIGATYNQIGIITRAVSENVLFALKLDAGLEAGTYEITPKISDLTQRYGSNEVVEAIIGSDTSKQVERLLQFDSNILKDLTFDAGSMLTVKTALLKSTGYNVWDEQWELGTISQGNGQNQESTTQIRSKNYIRVIPNSTYYFYVGAGYNNLDYVYISFYDINKNHIETLSNNARDTFNIPTNCAYIRFRTLNAYGTTYNHDICIFQYWDGSRIGYEPYEEKTETMPNVELNGILKVDVSGNVYADGDELYPDNTKNKKRYGVANTHNLVFNYNATSKWLSAELVGCATQQDWMPNAMSDLNYTKVHSTMLSHSDVAWTIYDGYLYIKNTSLTEQQLRNAIDNHIIIYELVEEQPLVANSYNPNLWADDFGHLQFLDENRNEINGLQGCEIFYKANISGFAESLYVRAEGEPENVVIQSERNADNLERDTVDTQLKNALGGTLRQCLAANSSKEFNNLEYIDMGELNWVYDNANERFTSSFSRISEYCADADNTTSVLCTKYQTISPKQWYQKTKVGVCQSARGYSSSHCVCLYDPTFTSADTLKASLKGVLLAYEKASE